MKPKCPKCDFARLRIENGGESPWVVCECGWSRRVSRAAIIRLATEPKKRKTCKWTLGRALANGSCGRRGYRTASTPKFCSDCGKPVEVVNG